MRYALVSDIHANLAAFKAVLEDLEAKGGFDEIWCLGDIVGYGPEPHACIELLLSQNYICVAGNHDWAAIGKIDTLDFNPDAASGLPVDSAATWRWGHGLVAGPSPSARAS